ncbi:MAG TPA: helix-turn-helix domain-containing protein, partial [Firmicutes bacterium]|nr:helix-turn-helix domain-containing protein [Bacillota bacterium]
MAGHIPPDYPERIKRLRQDLGLTQARLAELLGVSFASVNRWENAQSRPNRLAWRQIQLAEREGLNAFRGALYSNARTKQSPTADWLAEAAPDYETCPEAEPSLFTHVRGGGEKKQEDLILEAVAGEDEAAEAVRQIEARLTPEQVRAQLAERAKLSAGGDVARQLPRQRAELTCLELRRLLPGYVRLFIEEAAPLLDLGIEGDLEGSFTLRPLRPGAMDPLWPVLESYEPERQARFTVY